MNYLNFLICATFLCSFSATGQTTKGNWLVGGNGSLAYNSNKDKNGSGANSEIGISIRPKVGYFFYDKLAAGMQIPLYYSKPDEAKSSLGYGASPFLRYYLLNTDSRLNLLIGISYTYTQSHINGENRTNYSRGFTFEGGAAYFLNSSVAMEITGNYEATNITEYVSRNFYIAIGFQIHLIK